MEVERKGGGRGRRGGASLGKKGGEASLPVFISARFGRKGGGKGGNPYVPESRLRFRGSCRTLQKLYNHKRERA